MKKFARIRKCACGASMYLNCRWSPRNSSLWSDGVANGNREDEEERNAEVRRSNTCLQGGQFLLFRFLPLILSVQSMGRRSRALFSLLLAGETRKAKTRKEETAVGSQERVKDGKKISKRREVSPYGFACERLDVPRDFVLTREVACLLRCMKLFEFQLTLV